MKNKTNTFLKAQARKAWTAARLYAKRKALAAFRNVLWSVDSWVYDQELRLRAEIEAAKPAAVAPAQKRVERQKSAPKPKLPRLAYQHGEFARLEPHVR